MKIFYLRKTIARCKLDSKLYAVIKKLCDSKNWIDDSEMEDDYFYFFRKHSKEKADNITVVLRGMRDFFLFSNKPFAKWVEKNKLTLQQLTTLFKIWLLSSHKNYYIMSTLDSIYIDRPTRGITAVKR
jgi:hypothetical protein